MKVLVINNPRSGQGDARLYDYVRALGKRGVTEVSFRFLSNRETFDTAIRDARDFDRVVAAGGDGTVSAVAYALRETGVPILAYPAGTANLVALNLDLPPDPTRLAEITVGGGLATVDMGELECEAVDEWCTLRTGGMVSPGGTAGFLMAAGAGFDARLMESAQELKSTLGVGAYVVAALQNLNPTHAEISLELDGESVETDGIAVLVANFARLQFDLPVIHGSDPADGLLDVVVLRTRTPAGLIPAVWAALLDRTGDYPKRPASLEVRTASRIHISTDPPLPVQFDGEVVASSTPVSAKVLPRAATLVVPKDSPLLAK